jgi:hypothetical protein
MSDDDDWEYGDDDDDDPGDTSIWWQPVDGNTSPRTGVLECHVVCGPVCVGSVKRDPCSVH